MNPKLNYYYFKGIKNDLKQISLYPQFLLHYFHCCLFHYSTLLLSLNCFLILIFHHHLYCQIRCCCLNFLIQMIYHLICCFSFSFSFLFTFLIALFSIFPSFFGIFFPVSPFFLVLFAFQPLFFLTIFSLFPFFKGNSEPFVFFYSIFSDLFQ